MTPEEKAKFWMEVYTAAIRAVLDGNAGVSEKFALQATDRAVICADKALEDLNQRLQSPTHFR